MIQIDLSNTISLQKISMMDLKMGKWDILEFPVRIRYDSYRMNQLKLNLAYEIIESADLT